MPADWDNLSESTRLNGGMVAVGKSGLRIQTSAQALPVYQVYPWGHPVWRYDGSSTTTNNNSDASNALDGSWPSELQQPFVQRTPSRCSVVDLSALQPVAESQQQEQTQQQPQPECQLFQFTHENSPSPPSSDQGNVNTTNSTVSNGSRLSSTTPPAPTIPPPHPDASLSSDGEIGAAVQAIIANSERLYKQKKEEAARRKKASDKNPLSPQSSDNIPKKNRSTGSSSNSSDSVVQYDRKEGVQESGLTSEGHRAQAVNQRAIRRGGHAFV
ncbi:hypothetical protein BGW39_006227 [Mortierella sp. 14UC]|nr:hypothetical protein BGW39_006227 [Mortierella sp. 14UC]